MKLSIPSSALSSTLGWFGLAVYLLAPLLVAPSREKKRTEDPPRPPAPPVAHATEVQWFEPGQVDVTFESMFKDLLSSATKIKIVDPYIRSFRQIHILEEFLNFVSSTGGQGTTVHLFTSKASESREWAYGQTLALLDLQVKAEARGLKLLVTFDESIHDRWIETDEWTILLGKGLDIWEPSTCYSRTQEDRPISKKFAVSYHPAQR